jgi:hypothetical protein
MSHVSSFAREHRGLLALNAMLILVLLVVTFAPAARAQQGQRQRGDYLMVSARALGFPEAAVWVVDTNNQQLMVLRYDRSAKQLRFLGFRNMANDAREAERRGR